MSEVGQEDQSSEGIMLLIDLNAAKANEEREANDEELEWDTLFAQPHVQAGLDRLAEEAERQFAAGETEEGGFAVE